VPFVSEFATRIVKFAAKVLFIGIRLVCSPLLSVDRQQILLPVPAGTDEIGNDITGRAVFYLPGFSTVKIPLQGGQKASFRTIFSSTPVLLYGDNDFFPQWAQCFRGGIFNIDYQRNPYDGWVWHQLVEYATPRDESMADARERFSTCIRQLRRQSLTRSYVFGTGPSLEKALEHDWSDGYRIVCNTIVRDRKLWLHINPHIIVAADAIYHFGHTAFAKAFRRDIHDRLRETDTLFMYDDLFHHLVMREMADCRDRLIPIPTGSHTRIDVDLTREFAAPLLGNVLPHLLLPVACTLSREVFLLGFDGRAPDDKLFWSNSSCHTYSEHMDELRAAHPAFFEFFVPSAKPTQYVEKFHGDVLDQKLSDAEAHGCRFVMMHESWTPTLNRRYLPNQLPSAVVGKNTDL
jgi:hypothetical protein